MAGRYSIPQRRSARRPVFQSSPGLMAGRYFRQAVLAVVKGRFQSSPGLMAGRYAALQPRVTTASRFQSSPGLMAGRYGGFYYEVMRPGMVSILARLNGRALHPGCGYHLRGPAGFNPRPA